MREARHDTFPILGYVIINGVVIVLMLVAWYAAKTGLFLLPPVEAAGRPGVGALLVLVPICFLVATVFDVVWRMIARRRDVAATADSAAGAAPAIRKDTPSRDMPSKEIERV